MTRDLTTAQVARELGVSDTYVQTLCDKGLLKHYRLPLSGQRRVTPADLEAFKGAHGYPGAADAATTTEGNP